MDFEESLESWEEYYDMSPDHIELLMSLYKRRISHPQETIVLSKREVQLIGTGDEEGLSGARNHSGR